jgi:hypothetical protein
MKGFGMKAYAAGLCAAAIAATALVGAPADAQTYQAQKKYAPTTMRSTTANRPRTRVVVTPRSFLDAGTEVLPGERKFTDYAFPPTYTPLGVVTNWGARVGWHNSPLPGPFDLPSRYNPYGW